MFNIEENNPQSFFEDRGHIIAISLFFAGLFIFATGLGMVFFRTQVKSAEVELISATAGQVSGTKTSNQITVDIDGAVTNPGLYKLSSESRVNDAVVMAGGLAGDADRGAINLASKIADGQKIHIPAVGEAPVTGFGKLNNALVNINSGSEAELESLPQVGPATAAKIIAGRPYGSVEELLNKKVVSKSVFDKIRDLVSL